MKSSLRHLALLIPLALAAPLAFTQVERQREPQEHRSEDVILPNGKSQRDEILKAEHKKNLKDVQQLIDIAEQLKEELDRNDRYVLSLGAIKKTEEIEKLARNIRARMRRF